ncbi:RpiR family transcriptional regulator [Serratia liquefaciens]|uniref:MurR/RpiR family transcriptional regulator n=1 Tax=Serratia liquefaciens TaxID=614 RepID=UPI000D52251D|nr:MurR/RpiR family transcriptional regulator [Serratia liquefaciens]PVD44322.1 RpiR family transcriptional regulator [Serratia liquefaciens]QHT51048.1 MurR/RpiR family transcriptional regulator [Serratia liquefaciens]
MAEHPDVMAQIEASFAVQTPTGKRIAGYLLANLPQVPFETADSIARSTATSGISVGRYLRSLGYRNVEDLKRTLREQGTALRQPWGVTDRLGAYRRWREQPQPQKLRQSLTLELEAIEHVYQLAGGEAFAQVSRQLAQAEAVFVVGIQSTRGIANAFYSHLEYLRPKVYYADGLSGTYVESLNSEFSAPYLVLTDTRAYSTIAQKYCQAACARGLRLALITDIYCPWARDYPIDLLQVKTDTGQFWDSLAPLSCLFNLLLSSVLEQGGTAVEQRLASNRMLQKELGQFES